MAITQLDPTSGYNLKRYRDASGRLLPINRTGGIIQPATTQAGATNLKKTGFKYGPQLRSAGKFMPTPKNIFNVIGSKMPTAALRGLGPYGLLAGAGIGAYSLLSDEPITQEGLDLKVEEALQYSWGARALNPNTPTTENDETIRTAHDKHSKTGQWIVYPTIRSVDGELKKFSLKEAKRKAEMIGDYMSFNSEDDALKFSLHFSSKISQLRNRERNIGLLT